MKLNEYSQQLKLNGVTTDTLFLFVNHLQRPLNKFINRMLTEMSYA